MPAPPAPPGTVSTPADLGTRLTVVMTARAAFERQPCALRLRVVLESPHVPEVQKHAIHAAAHALGIDALSPSFDKDWQVMLAKQKALGPLAEGFLLECNPTLVSPIGYLHLERLCYFPDGVEHGELVYSLPLAPAERVAIVHRSG